MVRLTSRLCSRVTARLSGSVRRLGATAGRRFAVANLSSGALLCVLLAAAHAQSPYPTTNPNDTWGGHAVSQPVPFQPTLPAEEAACHSPAAHWIDTEVPDPNCAATPVPWQTYPSTDPSAQPVVPAAYPVVPADPYYAEGTPEAGPESLLPPGTRNGVFQKINFTGAYLPQFESDSLGMSDLELDVVFGLPFITRETPLVITPFYAVHFLDGPVTPDVPPRLHDAAVTFQHFRRLGDRWIVNGDLTLGEFADDHSFDAGDAFRITGSGAVVYESSPAWKWVLGAAYVDRANTTVLPIAGFVYTPHEDVEYKLVFPAPKISWRLPWTAVPGRDERWLYVAGEFGGGVWAVERASGATDELDITDWRVFLGLERKIIGGLSRRCEIGYVFGRQMEYASNGAEISLDDTLMLRIGLTY